MSTRYVALLRAVNVGGRNSVPMVELRALATEIGLLDPVTYIQSGNLVFFSAEDISFLEAKLEEAVRDRFGVISPVIVRGAGTWQRYLGSNPFVDEAAAAPNRVMLAVAKQPPQARALEEIAAKAQGGEQVALTTDGALWIMFPEGQGRSKITPAVLDRAVGSPVTTRNLSTVRKLGELLGGDRA